MARLVTSPEPLALMGGVHETSARAALLIGLGEFLWPASHDVWASTLVRFLGEFGYEPNAARKAIQRTASSGLIAPQHEGRRVRWHLTDKGDQIYSIGFQRVFGWDPRETEWDGRWLLLTATVPESLRKVRHHLQAKLAWTGLGSPTTGHWITPHVSREPEVTRIVRELDLVSHSQLFIAIHGGLGDESEFVNDAWDINALATEYRHFVGQFSGSDAPNDRNSMVRQVELVQAWRKFPYLDPDLPPQFLPRDWPGFEAVKVFHQRHELLRLASARYWQTLLQETE